MKKFLAVLAAAIINTPILFAGAHVNIPIDHLVDGMPVIFMVTGQKITPQQRETFESMFGKIAQIGGADLKMSATTSIAPSPR